MKNYIQNPNQKVVITFDKNTTLARIYEDNKVIAKGTAVCCSEDTFDIKAGSELALSRALEAMKPKADPKNQEWVVVSRKPMPGDFVRLKYAKYSFTQKGDIIKVNECRDGYFNALAGDHPDRAGASRIFGEKWAWNYVAGEVEVVEPAPKKPEEPQYRKITRLPKKGDYVRVIKSLYSFDKPDRYIELDTVAIDCNGKLKGFSVAYGKHPGAIEADCDWAFGWHYYMGSTVAEFYEKV